MNAKENNDSLLKHCKGCSHYNNGEGNRECLKCSHVRELTKPERVESEPTLFYRDDIDEFASTENTIVYGNEKDSIASTLREYCSDKAELIVNATIFLQCFILGITIAKLAFIYNVTEKTIKNRLQSVVGFLKGKLTKEEV